MRIEAYILLLTVVSVIAWMIGIWTGYGDYSKLRNRVLNHECAPLVFHSMLDKTKYPGQVVCQDKDDPTKLEVKDMSWLE